MEKLEELVKELEVLEKAIPEKFVEKSGTLEEEISEKLREIMETFLLGYHVEFGAYKIYPIVVEAYHYKENIYEDSSVYKKERQKNHYGELFIHNVKNKNDGLDICLSRNDNYYLSILIKNAFIEFNGNTYFATQSMVSKLICENCKGCEKIVNCKFCKEDLKLNVLFKNDENKSKVIFLPRKNINNNFSDKRLAALTIDSIYKYGGYLTLAKGHVKQWRCSVIAITMHEEMGEARKLADNINGFKIEDKYFELAKESMGVKLE